MSKRKSEYYHPTNNKAMTQSISAIDGSKLYAELKQQITQAGILHRSYGYYAFLTAIVLPGFALTFFMMYLAGTIPVVLFWAFLFALFGVQMGGLMHDAGHRAIAKTTKWNDFWGHVYAIPLAFPFAAWRTNHNEHHANPNTDEEDPDIELPFIAMTDEAYRSRRGLQKLLRPFQAYTWYPFGTLVSITKRVYGFKYFKKNLSKKTLWQVPFFLAGIFLWAVLPFLLFPFAKALTIVLASNLILGFFLANIFAPNHKGMPHVKKGTKPSFIEHQIVTARNIKGGFLTDLFYIGLNYQIEHHLFPNTPRNKLKYITPYAKKVAKQRKWDYTVVSVLESNKIIFNELQAIVKRNKGL